MKSLFLICAASALAPIVSAQSGVSGSESSIAPAGNLNSAGGATGSAGYAAETSLAFAGGATASSSANYSFRGGALWSENGFAPPGPAVFGVLQGSGSKAGGDTVTVVGSGFLGGGPISVEVGGAAASGVTVVSDTELSLVTPPGVNVYGNPLGASDVTVGDGLTTATATDAYVYTPALTAPAELRIGAPYEIAMYATPGALIDLYIGVAIPGVVLPIGGLDGAFEMLGFFLSPTSSTFAGPEPQVWGFPLPKDPNLVGLAFQWQGFELTNFAPLTGSFTNRLSTPIGG
ncbi:IPT/TIG domain-containing protein [Engelhardtia mirabilis]|uniref:IPT/TIG domain-containing protein n=1 Tax=Engelhardtia mirabilis TaxID=2528011 RepID=A0A518BG17_9BACT|nr:hypothetical protein Pla133_09290 [Planctomycetes bacterium Pla133]QDV00189.1 hypothetical protein Pla86_09280 [Planctomycetes bacterium Pla86]